MKKYLLLFFMIVSSIMASAQSTKELIDKVADCSKYEGYDYVVVYDSTDVVMEDSGLSHVNMHKVIKMLTYRGCEQNNVVKIDYDPLSAYVEIKEVKIHRNDGTTETVTNPVLDYVAPARMIYWNASQKMVEVGHLEPGDAIEIVSYKKGYTYALLQSDDDSKYIPPMRGHYYDIIEFFGNQPIINKVYTVSVLKSKELQFEVYNGELKTAAYNRGDRMVYKFEKRDIMPVHTPRNTVAKSDILTKLLLSTSPDWYAKSIWFYGVNEDYGSFTSTKAVKDKVDELLKPAKTELDSISILTHWVADNMRYSGLSMGPGEGYTLHNAEMNFTDMCGVCKDKASLLIAMLRAAGFKSYAAMTMAGSRIDRIPADQFNHSVTVVQRRNGEYQLLDPTWVPNTRELWSSAEQQQNYLMGLPEGADLMETPISPSENHYVIVNGKSEIKNDGTLIGEFSIEAEGQSDAAVRGVFSGRYSDWDNAVRAELLRIDPRAIITSVKYTDSDEYLKQPVAISYKYQIPNYATISENEIIFTPLLAKNVFKRAMAHLYMDTSVETRDYAFSDRCSRLVKITENITLPKYSETIYIPESKEITSEYVNYNGGYVINKRNLKFHQTIDLGKRIYQAEEWQDFRNAVINQNNFANENIILKK